jgi:hypothetical protein
MYKLYLERSSSTSTLLCVSCGEEGSVPVQHVAPFLSIRGFVLSKYQVLGLSTESGSISCIHFFTWLLLGAS